MRLASDCVVFMPPCTTPPNALIHVFNPLGRVSKAVVPLVTPAVVASIVFVVAFLLGLTPRRIVSPLVAVPLTGLAAAAWYLEPTWLAPSTSAAVAVGIGAAVAFAAALGGRRKSVCRGCFAVLRRGWVPDNDGIRFVFFVVLFATRPWLGIRLPRASVQPPRVVSLE